MHFFFLLGSVRIEKIITFLKGNEEPWPRAAEPLRGLKPSRERSIGHFRGIGGGVQRKAGMISKGISEAGGLR